MEYYFAPLEGITGYIFRNAYEKYYGSQILGGFAKYFAPFISPADNCPMNPKERRDILPENNTGITLIPQILTCKSRHFLMCLEVLMQYGYQEVNLNLGCPSGTVTAKKKGAGFLSELDELEAFLDDIYEFAEGNSIKISLKTRIGRNDPEEWYNLLELYNQYPVHELIIHPRIAKDFYKGEPRLTYYEYAREHSKNPIVYNGNLFYEDDLKQRDLAGDSVLMLGRGLLWNPELLINSGQAAGDVLDREFDYKRFRAFHDEIYAGYKEIMAPDINVLHRMKELWTYWKELFPDCDRTYRNIMKTKKYSEYDILVSSLFRSVE